MPGSSTNGSCPYFGWGSKWIFISALATIFLISWLIDGGSHCVITPVVAGGISMTSLHRFDRGGNLSLKGICHGLGRPL